ncbi:MAG: hypothetical protein VST69_03780 [Nitrospirota bacterium]|nr:hypothetical protein [Nitrospirota bacterium]
MAMSKKRTIEIALAQMSMTLNEIIRDEQLYETLYEPDSCEKREAVFSDCRDRSFEQTQLMSPFLWN